ncbi:glycosyltransferase family 4 protein [Candidatus Bathyarchaeota archaeon]|nr:glycosyltransferase family 4 protein [Candidatus Bathyarchaeota archaeon]
MDCGLKIMMFTWEFPPRIVGGISPHVYHLSRRLVKKGAKVYVVTCDFPGAPEHEIIDGVEVFRIDSYRHPAPDFASWVYLMNMNMQREAAAIIRDIGEIDVLHAHDWLVASASVGLKHIFRKPLISTIHSTEVGRRGGLHSDYERMIHETEAWLTYESWRVICCSHYMLSHVKWIFSLPEDKMVMIPNGVDLEDYEKYSRKDLEEFRSRFALPDEKIVLFVGRLVYEKGAQVLIKAAPQIFEKVNAKIVIVGNGYMKESLSSLAHSLGIAHKVCFTGFLDEESLKKLQICADVSVVPSLYEPFGIVALEAMAAKSPLVVSDTGGLSEIVEHDVTGVKVYPNDPNSLAWGVTKVLLDEKYAYQIRENAYRRVREVFNWDKISQRTMEVYRTVLDDFSRTIWV